MGGTGGQDNNMLGNLMSSLNSQQGNDIIGNLMKNGNSGNVSSGNVGSGNGSSSNKNQISKVVKNNKDNFDQNNDLSDSVEDDDEQVNPFSNLFSGTGSIDLSQISNMLSGIDFNNLDLNNTNINEIMNTISNSNSFESNDVEFKHTNPKERTHNILENLEHEDAGQLIYILAHLVDDKKLEMLNKIVEENSK